MDGDGEENQDQEQEEVGGGGGSGIEVPQQVADLAEASVPNAIRGIRACKRCGILKTLDQFINEGTLHNYVLATVLYSYLQNEIA
jgi:hypothetical protein